MRASTLRNCKACAGALAVTLVLVAVMPLLLKFTGPPPKEQVRDAINLVNAMKIKPPPPKKKEVRQERTPPPKINPKLKDIMPKFDSTSMLDVPFQFDLGLAGDDAGMALSTGVKIWNESDVDVKPVPLFRSRPSYPAQAMAKGITGSVAFKFLVDADGMVSSVEIIRSEPEEIFDTATINAVRQWRFQPAKIKGEPVACWAQSSINYELDLN
jgi:TonB family protein